MTGLALLAEADLDWVTDAVDVVERCAGQPWRIALERLDDLQRAEQPAAPRRFSAVVAAMQRLTGGRSRNVRDARDARGLVLGRPVFGALERQARIAAAAQVLAVSPAMVESMLWSDLPRERPVELPYGRPLELEVAAFANVGLLQRALRRAQSATLRIGDDAGPILRAAGSRGLLANASTTTAGETIIEIVGPLALLHRTSVYGRALGELVPLLGGLRRFALEVFVETATSSYTIHVVSPVLLPAPPPRLTAVPYPIARLARQLERAAPDLAITPMPPLLTAGSAVLCPDLAIDRDGRRCYVELVGFWTADYLERKVAAYRRAGAGDVVLCVDGARGRAADDLPSECVVFEKQVAPEQILGDLAIFNRYADEYTELIDDVLALSADAEDEL